MPNPERITCGMCSRSFHNIEQLSQHKRDSHKIAPTEDKNKGDHNTDRLKCPQCTRLFTSNDSLKQHIGASHATLVGGNSKTSTVVAAESHATASSVLAPKVQKAHTCRECSKDFNTLAQLEQHMTAKHGARTQKEVISSATETFTCPGLSKSFATPSQREQHITNTGHGDGNIATGSKKAHACDTCPKTFDTFEQLEQHTKATGHSVHKKASKDEGQKTGKYLCTKCLRSYTSVDALRQHESASHGTPLKTTGPLQNEKKSSIIDPSNQGKLDKSMSEEVVTEKIPCNICKRSFSNIESLNQHTVASHGGQMNTVSSTISDVRAKEDTKAITRQETKNHLGCKFCNRSFTSAASMEQHEKASHGKETSSASSVSSHPKTNLQNSPEHKKEMKLRCPKCALEFNSSESLIQHQKATGHLLKKETKATVTYIWSVLNQKAAVKEDDRKESVAIVKENVDKIMAYVRTLEGGKIYLPDLRKAGSSSVKTKIGKADEFDKIITLNVKITDVRTNGLLNYKYKDKLTDSEETGSGRNMNIERELVATQKLQIDIPTGQASVRVDEKVPSYLKHEGDLIPHKVQLDLHRKVKEAIDKLNLKDVYLSKMAHGPAITLTIKGPTHDINIDFTVSLPCEKFIKVTEAGWPRKETKDAFSPEHITACINEGLHLVPKGDETWSISYSKAEKTLFQKIDGKNTCRRQVIQFMKWKLQDCKSKSTDGLPGISSFLVKQQVLWSSEEKRDPDYWQMGNIETCVLDTMADFVNSLRSRILTHYFNQKKNLFSNKSNNVLQRVADFFEEELKRLKGMHTRE